MFDGISENSFRITPLNFSEEVQKKFRESVRAFDLNLVRGEFDLTLTQSESLDAMDVMWKMFKSKVAFQIDTFTNRGASVFSLIALDCVAQNHQYAMNYDGMGLAVHKLSIVARQIIRAGPGGDLSLSKDDAGLEDGDRMMAKLSMVNPKDH